MLLITQTSNAILPLLYSPSGLAGTNSPVSPIGKTDIHVGCIQTAGITIIHTASHT